MPRKGDCKDFQRLLAYHQELPQATNETGWVKPKRISGPPGRKRAALGAWLPLQLRANLDLILAELSDALEKGRGVRVSTATMSCAIRRLPGDWALGKVALRLRARRRRTDGVAGGVRDAHFHGVTVPTCPPPWDERAYGGVPRNRDKDLYADRLAFA